jgi:hypothetical protein
MFIECGAGVANASIHFGDPIRVDGRPDGWEVVDSLYNIEQPDGYHECVVYPIAPAQAPKWFDRLYQRINLPVGSGFETIVLTPSDLRWVPGRSNCQFWQVCRLPAGWHVGENEEGLFFKNAHRGY